jgi:hypothetical protein
MHIPFKAISFRATALVAVLLCLSSAVPALAQGDAPEVVEMVPANGARDVDPSLKEIVVTFSVPMKNQSWSVMKAGGAFPDIKSVYYREGFETFVMEVALKPGTTYIFGLNGPSNPGFKSRAGVPLAPMQVTFTTSGEKGAADAAAAGASEEPEQEGLGRIAFDLVDANGVRVRSQDYSGVPLFLSSGAAW